jgi:rare lipoprotein A
MGSVVMVDARTARTQTAVCKVIGAVIAVGVALTCGGAASAEPGRAGAPISYASAKPAARTAQPLPAGPIDLRPGAIPVNFGPAPAASRSGAVAPMALRNDPSRTASNARPATSQQPTALTKPYAGPPYEVDGKWYVPTYEPDYNEVGVASWYGPTFHGEKSASGEVFDEMAITAAHPTLPIPSLVRVTNLENGKSIIVRLNDRGPFVDDRIIDLSRGSAEALDMRVKGTAKVRVQYVGPAPAAPNTTPPGESMFAAAPTAPTMLAQNSYGLSTEALPPLVPAEPARAPVIEYRSAAPQPHNQDQAGVYLQAGSFSDLGNAHQQRDRMMSHGPAFVTSAQVNGSVFYRVMVGPWPSRAAAEQMQDRMRSSGAKTLVVAQLDR